ncbi:MAG: hypothetical protein AB7W59_12155 [Acidimicrobiia bacterium]
MRACPACGRANDDDDAVRCEHCGASLPSSPYGRYRRTAFPTIPDQVGEPDLPPGGMLRQPEPPPTAPAGPVAPAPRPAERGCARCGAPNAVDSAYCTTCGSPLGQGAAAGATTVAAAAVAPDVAPAPAGGPGAPPDPPDTPAAPMPAVSPAPTAVAVAPRRDRRPAILGALAAVAVFAVVLTWLVLRAVGGGGDGEGGDGGGTAASTSTVTETGSSVTTAEPGSPLAGLAACPDAATLTAVAQQAGGDFALGTTPPAATAVVLQLLTADFVITVCRDDAGGYWYFSRGRAADAQQLGVFSPARVADGAIAAPYPPRTDDEYVVTATGVSLRSTGAVLPAVEVRCSSTAQLPAAFAATADAPRCAPGVVVPWGV